MVGKKRTPPKDDKRPIPAYFQTWGDMMMNMLTLFILMCSFAQERQNEFFAAGLGSFVNALESHGLPGLLPSDTKSLFLDEYDDRFESPMEATDVDETNPSAYDTMDDINLNQALNEGEIWVPESVLFKRGSSRLSDEARDWLQSQLIYFQGQGLQIEVIGHAWSECIAEPAHRKLSLNRAYAVIAYLNEVGGIELSRMHAVGFGSSRPMADGEKDPGLNRRVNIKLSKSR